MLFHFSFYLLIFSLFFNSANFAYAQQSETNSKTVKISQTDIRGEISNIENRLEDRLQTYLDAQIPKSLDDRIKTTVNHLNVQRQEHFQSLNQLIQQTHETFKWLVTFAMAAGTALWTIGAFLFWYQGKNLQDLIRSRYDEANKKVDENVKLLTEGLAKFESIKIQYEAAIAENEELKKRLHSLSAFKKKVILWAFENQEVKFEAEKEIKKIESKGFKNFLFWRLDETPPRRSFDLMIYVYAKSDSSIQALGAVRKYLYENGADKPLIIYTYYGKKANISEKEKEVFFGYRHYALSNMPLTLYNYFDTLIRD